MTDSMGPGKLVRHMQNLLYTYDEYLICIGLGPSISSVICKNPSYSGPSYPSSPIYIYIYICCSPTSDPAHLKMGQAQLPIGSWAGFCWPILRWATQLPMTQIIQQPSPTSDGNDFLLSVHLEVYS